MRIFLGFILGLGFSSFSLGHHVFNCKGVLGGIGIGFTLCLLLRLLFWPRDPHITIFLFWNPYWYFSPLWRVLSGEELLGRRKRKGCGRRKSSWILSDIFWIVYLIWFPQIGVCRDSCPIKGLMVCFGAIVPANHRHLCSQPCLHLQYPALVSYCLCGLSSFLGHF